jgi:NAD+ diphosphatase
MASIEHRHDRAVERRDDPEWLLEQWQCPTSLVVVVHGDQVIVQGGSQWCAPSAAPRGERYLLGVDRDGRARFALHVTAPPPGAESTGLREVAATGSAEDAGWACHAVALSQWHATHTHCPRCGSATEVASAGSTRRCPADGSLHFPRVDPAVIVLVTDAGDRALLGRQDAWPLGRFSTLAGFVEPGESAEQAVVREVAEEASVAVDEVALVATQPWPFPSSLMVGAVAVAREASEPHPDGDELAEVRWFSRAELHDAVLDGSVMVPGPLSISRWLIDRWYGGELPDDRLGWR